MTPFLFEITDRQS